MKQLIISHRGNINGENHKQENQPDYLLEAARLYDVEVDVWVENQSIKLGHDYGEYHVSLNFVQNPRFWCHAKSIEALYFLMQNGVRCFFHDQDAATLTSNGYIWTYPGKMLTDRSIAVLPEWRDCADTSKAYGICTDFPLKYDGAATSL